MILDISKIDEFNTSLFHHMVEHKDVLILVGRNKKIEVAMKILGIDKIIKHEKLILTEV